MHYSEGRERCVKGEGGCIIERVRGCGFYCRV